MIGVLQGFTVIAVIIGVGVVLGRTRWLGENGRSVLTKLAFWVATPALMFQLLAEADLVALFSSQFTVTAVAMLVIAGLYGAVAMIRKWGLGPGTVGAMVSSYVNSGNLGIPIAVYVLGDATLVAPVMLVQQLIMNPVLMALLDIATRDRSVGALRWWHYVVRPFRNPIVIGALSGLGCGVLSSVAPGFEVPSFVMAPIALIGGMSVPAVLLAFGMSLRDSTMPFGGPERGQVLLSTFLKAFVHPVVAWLLAVYVFGIDGHMLLAVVVTAALPAAQNIFTYASEYGTGEKLARESILLTTILSVPVVFVVTLLIHP